MVTVTLLSRKVPCRGHHSHSYFRLMSRENVERFRQINDAYNRRDIDAFLALCDHDIEFRSTFAGLGGDMYRGYDGLRQWHRDQVDAWETEIWSEPEAFLDLGEYTVMFNILRGRGRHSGAGVERREAMVARWRDGRIRNLTAYSDRDEALHDLGISREDLDLIEP